MRDTGDLAAAIDEVNAQLMEVSSAVRRADIEEAFLRGILCTREGWNGQHLTDGFAPDKLLDQSDGIFSPCEPQAAIDKLREDPGVDRLLKLLREEMECDTEKTLDELDAEIDDDS